MSEKELTIHKIHTCCKNCVFAKYDEDTQTDCQLGYLEFFRSKNVEILEVYDEEKEFYVINDKYCLGLKDKKWFKKRGMKNPSLEEMVEAHNKDNYIKYTLWIDLYDFTKQEKLDELSSILKSVPVKPSNILFIRYVNRQTELHGFENIKAILRNADLNQTEWRIETWLLERDKDAQTRHAIMNCVNRFCCIVTNIPNKLDKIVAKADHKISKEMGSLNMLSNPDLSAIFLPVFTYKYTLHFLETELLKQKDAYEIIE